MELIDKDAESKQERLLSGLPSYLLFDQVMKARPATEGGKRYVYIEASSEGRDYQGEVILAKALAESADYYLRYGNLDLDHYTQIGRPNPAKGWPGIPDYELFEIGRPVDVRIDGKSSFVKGVIKSGSGVAAAKAEMFWSSLTEVSPPERWYPSVGGGVLEKAVKVDPSTGEEYPVITKVRWSNIGFSKTPVNPDVPEVSLVPIGTLVKSWGVHGLDLRKSLTAGYGTDSATLVGGDALRGGGGVARRNNKGQDGVLDYWNFRDEMARAIKHGEFQPDMKTMVSEAASRFQLSKADASEYVERFLDDLNRGITDLKALKEKRDV